MWGALSLTRGRVYRLQLLLASPAQSFSGPSPLTLVTIFYCLRFETSLFVASYDSQGYGGGIRLRLHTGVTASRPLIYFTATIENVCCLSVNTETFVDSVDKENAFCTELVPRNPLP
jgi:hypothetical protein